ncbi:MAG: DUF115 domain-containing protein [Candidatus Lokiarchaeota archaeon]|nr:DUF115 domain-containing protein [Candidatus Lokiarchaeota archaeon]
MAQMIGGVRLDLEDWLPYYEAIVKDLGLDREQDTLSARILSDILSSNVRVAGARLSEEKAGSLISGRDTFILGGGPELEPELDRLISIRTGEGTWTPSDTGTDILITADGATSVLLSRGYVPHVIVTDMDGGVEDQMACLREGSVMFLHAHGDNQDILEKIGPRLEGNVIGTTQVEPEKGSGLRNYGGFTDGDRAAFISRHFRPMSIELLGFDLDIVADKIIDGGTRRSMSGPGLSEMKYRKLIWANLLLGAITEPKIRFFGHDRRTM